MNTTETISSRYAGLDSWGDAAILDALVEGQERAVSAVKDAREALAKAAAAIVARLGDSGRIFYAGAGSSGLIAALDGMELAGTFGWPEARTVFLLANGRTLEPGLPGGDEDDGERGRAEMVLHAPSPADAVIALSASGTTAFTLSATAAAREAGALTIGIANNRDALLLGRVDVPVFLDSGPEIIVGSTRMGAGTAQKAALGLLSSLVMIRLGHVYDGLMVNLRADNRKLRQRAVGIVMHIGGGTAAQAEAALAESGGSVKIAALVLSGAGPAEAERLLTETRGNLRAALARLGRAGA